MENLKNSGSRKRSEIIDLKDNSVGVKKPEKQIKGTVPNLKNKQYDSPVSKNRKPNYSTINTWLTKDLPQRHLTNTKKSHRKFSEACNEGLPKQIGRCKSDRKNVLSSKIDSKVTTDCISNEDIIKNKSGVSSNTAGKYTVKKEEEKKKKIDKYNIKETISNKQKLETCDNNNKIESVEMGKNKKVSTSHKTDEKEDTVRKKFKRIITSPLKHNTSIRRNENGSPQSNKITKWLNKEVNDSPSSSSKSDSKKNQLDKKITTGIEKYKFPEKENSAIVSRRKKAGCNKNKFEPKETIKSPKSTKYKNTSRVMQDKTELKGKHSVDNTDCKKKMKECEKLDIKIDHNNASKKKHRSKNKVATQTLDKYLNKTSDRSAKRKYPKTDATEGCEFSSSVNKKKLKSSRSSDSFKKYGVSVPSVEEILKEQNDLVQYKNQIESFQDIDDKIFELPFSVKDLNAGQVVQNNILGCKHLSVHDIEKAFYNNFDYISAIFNGTKYSERHERFFNKVKSYAFTVKDLCYNTSTIVFNFEQQEQMISLLKKELDSDDKWTLYFFQVLLPELCLKIFMDTHGMEYEEAVEYLDNRPISDD